VEKYNTLLADHLTINAFIWSFTCEWITLHILLTQGTLSPNRACYILVNIMMFLLISENGSNNIRFWRQSGRSAPFKVHHHK